MNDSIIQPSSQLLAANRKLHQLREHQNREVSVLPNEAPGSDSLLEPVHFLPEHLGWGSNALTAVLRRKRSLDHAKDGQEWLNRLAKTAVPCSPALDVGGGRAIFN